MKLGEAGYLLDANVLSALVLGDHRHHSVATRWLAETSDALWGTCVLTQAAFLRVMTNPRAGGLNMEASREALAVIARHPRHRFWPIAESCNNLTAMFADRLFGHQQLTDALLLGMAVSENGVLVTMDQGVRHLAGSSYKQHVLLLEA